MVLGKWIYVVCQTSQKLKSDEIADALGAALSVAALVSSLRLFFPIFGPGLWKIFESSSMVVQVTDFPKKASCHGRDLFEQHQTSPDEVQDDRSVPAKLLEVSGSG